MVEKDLCAMWDKQGGSLSHASLLCITANHNNGYENENIVAIQVGENLSSTFQSGDVIAFDQHGEHFCLDGLEFDILIPDLYSYEKLL
jgi:fatty acid-binding protein DegV